MKILKHNWMALVVVLGLFLNSVSFAADRNGKENERSLRKPLVLSATNFDGNRIDNDMENNGMIVSYNISGRSGLSWPAGNGTQTIFASGVWLGGKVNNQVRVVVGEFSGEFVGGPWGSDWNAAEHKLYKVSKSDLADPLANADFQNWPTQYGAPFTDNNGNGTYEPLPSGPDTPEFIGDQVIWAVMNDGDPTAHSVFHSAPMGIEYQMTVFGFDRPDAFGDMMFVKALLINKGEETIEDAIIGLWSDPDLGYATDDFVGCDTTLGMGIVYNDGVDPDFANYSGGTPAAAYDFFQGPMVPSVGDTAFMFGRKIPNMRNLKMTSFSKYINTDDPEWDDPEDAEEAYAFMSGLKANGDPFPYAATGGGRYIHPGDPRLDTGPNDTEYVDADLHPSEDRRFLMNAGPFVMVPGDSQEVVFGIMMGAAGSALDSYGYIKEIDALAQLAYDIQFALPPSPPNPEVEISTFEDEIILSWDAAAESYVAEDLVDKDPDGNSTEFVFEGYNVYQVETATGSGEVKRIATYDLVNGITEIFDDVFDANFGETINRRVQFGSDSGLKRSISITSDALNDGSLLLQNRSYYFAVTAYGYNPYGIPKTLESSFDVKSIRPQMNTVWEAGDETAVYGTAIAGEHSAGGSDGTGTGIVVDPKSLTGDEYEIFFQDETYYRDVDGLWKNVNSGGKEALQKILDCSGSMITVAALASATIGTYDLTFNFAMDCGSNWVDGIMLDFPDDVVINSWDQVGDCSNGADAGQNCVNMEGTLDAATNSITWGDDARSGFGMIEHGQTWVVNIQPTTFPIAVDYVVYDDVYDGTQVDAVGTATADELGYDMVTVEGWYARNLDTGEIVTPHTTIQSGYAGVNVVDGVLIPAHAAGADANPIAEGLQFVVNGPALTMKWVGVVANASGPLDPIRDGMAGWRFPDWLPNAEHTEDGQQSTTDAVWFFNTHPTYGAASPAVFFGSLVAFSGGISSPNAGIAALIPYDFELRFTGNGKAFDNWDGLPGETYYDVPFEWWNIGSGTPDDPSDDYQLISWLLDDNTDGVDEPDGKWGLRPVDHETSSGNDDPYTDRVYVHAPYNNTPGTQGHDDFFANVTESSTVAPWYDRLDDGSPLATWNNFSRTVLMNWDGGDVADHPNYNALEPEIGTVWRFVTTKPNTLADKFTVATAGVLGKTVDYDPDGIGVWPNPYFAFNPEERTPVDQQVHFTNLPMTGKCMIRIFDLAGVPVRAIDHTADDNIHKGTTLDIWNLKNDSNIPVASGMYIAVVETDQGQKTLKLAVVQPEQRLDIY